MLFLKSRTIASVARARQAKAGLNSACRTFVSAMANRSAAVEEPEATVFTSLNDENDPQRKAFFEYSWGTWMSNNAAEKAARETPFSLTGLSEIVKKQQKKAAGVAPIEAEAEIKTMVSLHEGKHHHIYRVDLKNGQQYVLRVPYQLGSEDYLKHRVSSEVATMDFLQKKYGVNMPQVIDWSASSKDSLLDTQYQLLEFIPGHTLMKSWDPMEKDMNIRAQTIKPIVEFMEKITATKFNKFGSLYFTEDVESSLQSDLPYNGEKDAALADRWRIGPTTESRFWKNDLIDTAKYRGPWNTVDEYLQATANVEVANFEQKLAKLEDKSSAEADLYSHAISVFQKYGQLAPKLLVADEVPDKDLLFSPRLHNPDLHPINVILKPNENEGDLATPYLLDVENTAIRPFIFHGTPQFVAYNGPKVFSTADIPTFEQLSEIEKAQVNFMITQTQNQFSFEFILNQVMPKFINAYAPRVKKMSEIVHQVTTGRKYDEEVVDLMEEMVRLGNDWNQLFLAHQGNDAAESKSRGYPISFTEEELAAHQKRLAAWSEKATKMAFYTTKGWVPQDLFEEYLGKGIIVPKGNGDYEFGTSLRQ
ncbi:hypothetical protein NADFUDRAFT_82506 [Nadsonia fulvescens var. elongata DSM 6958]|uniref:Altered inheritance of mitochondria protein 9, mitochondrial n=1 Tax=Nadsonia fulvescens var. elongata DSM 6958 TaxID=857566 RepID=A0A1E3PMY6_9ASCO|nr:hypothetical protein NADFUDRAFT_82506 [Nadsonia fulvescens var. elongata DSM 6958]